MLQGYVDRGDLPGALALVHRRGEEAYFAIVGSGDYEGTLPLSRDTLFRIGSMTKPIVSVAALTLLEEGRLRLSDRVDKWLPELSAPKVLKDPLSKLDDVAPSPRPITVEDLLTHRPGFATALVAQGDLGQAVQVLTGGFGQRSDMEPDAWMAALGSLPLACAPGEQVINGFATDVLGVLISRLCGKPLGEVLEERIFGPVGMKDTAFWAPPEKLSRLAPAYVLRWLSNKKVLADHPNDSSWAKNPSFPSGSGGLLSTADDFLRFGRMLLGGGAIDGQRVLSRKTVELMTTDFLTPEQRRMPFFGADFWADRGLGLGVYVVDGLARHNGPATVGQYGWSGAFATAWFNDPAEDLVAVMMAQMAFPAVTPPVRNDFETMVYQAITD